MLVTLLVDEAARGDPTAIGLAQQLTNFRYLALIHLCADVLDCTNQLSRTLQRRDVGFSSLKSAISDCIASLEGMKTSDGQRLAGFNTALVCETSDNITKVTFQSHKLNVIAPKLVQNMRAMVKQTLLFQQPTEMTALLSHAKSF